MVGERLDLKVSSLRKRNSLSHQESAGLTSGPAVQIFPVSPAQLAITFHPHNTVNEALWKGIYEPLRMPFNNPLFTAEQIQEEPEEGEEKSYSEDSFESDDADDARIMMGHTISGMVKSVADGSAIANSFLSKILSDVQATVNDVLSEASEESDEEDLEGEIEISEEDEPPPLLPTFEDPEDFSLDQRSPSQVLTSLHKNPVSVPKVPCIFDIVKTEELQLKQSQIVKNWMQRALNPIMFRTGADEFEQDAREEDEYFRILRNYIKCKRNAGVQTASDDTSSLGVQTYTPTCDAASGDLPIVAPSFAAKKVQTLARHAANQSRQSLFQEVLPLDIDPSRRKLACCQDLPILRPAAIRSLRLFEKAAYSDAPVIEDDDEDFKRDSSRDEEDTKLPQTPHVRTEENSTSKIPKTIPLEIDLSRRQLAKVPENPFAECSERMALRLENEMKRASSCTDLPKAAVLPHFASYTLYRRRSLKSVQADEGKRSIPLPDRVLPLDIDLSRRQLANLPQPASIPMKTSQEPDAQGWHMLSTSCIELNGWISVDNNLEDQKSDRDWILM